MACRSTAGPTEPSREQQPRRRRAARCDRNPVEPDAGDAGLAQSVTFGSRSIVVGDSVAKVFDVVGKPDRAVQLQIRVGAAMGERIEYDRGG